MGTKNLSLFSTLIFLVLMFGLTTSDFSQDMAECTDKLISLTNCLPFVNGQSKTPTVACCTALKNVVDKNMRCLCILIKDRDDPNLGFKVNVTLTLQLPNECSTPTNVSQCVDLLHLAPESHEAKEFEGFQKSLDINSSTTVPPASNVTGNGTSTRIEDKNGGGWGKRWLVAELLRGVVPFVLVSYFFIV